MNDKTTRPLIDRLRRLFADEEDFALVKSRAHCPTVAAALKKEARDLVDFAKTCGKPNAMIREVFARRLVDVARKTVRKTRTAEEIKIAREAALASIGDYFESAPDHKASDLNALVKAGKIEKRVKKTWGTAPVRDGLFGGTNTCRRNVAEYRLAK